MACEAQLDRPICLSRVTLNHLAPSFAKPGPPNLDVTDHSTRRVRPNVGHEGQEKSPAVLTVRSMEGSGPVRIVREFTAPHAGVNVFYRL